MIAYDFQVLKLTQSFFDAYPNPPYTELEMKENRRYNCLLLQTHYDYYICIPFRSRVNHKYAYHFKQSKRSKRSKSALDYSKIAIITDPDYIDTAPGVVDSDEYTEMIKHLDRIVREAVRYVEDYVSYFQKEAGTIVEKEFIRRYQFTTLKYFHPQLGLKDK